MKKHFIPLVGILAFSLFFACKKDKPQNPESEVPQVTPTEVRVSLPAGTSLDLAKTKIYTLGDVADVSADGKSTIPLLSDGQLVFLFDESDKVIMQSYITSVNKEISIKTTAQALLFQGLKYILLPDSLKFDFLSKSASSAALATYYARMEQSFKSDAHMLNSEACKSLLNETLVSLIEKNPLNIYGKQVDIIDDDIRSYLQIKEVDDENVEIVNTNYRRSHAFVYKTAFKNQQGQETVLLNQIDYDDASDQNMKVKRVRYVPNSFDLIDVARGFKAVSTGPIHLPLSTGETEATYKIRILGPGMQVNTSLTTIEQAKLEELYYEYLAFDILAPIYLDVLGLKTQISNIHEEDLKSFGDKVKIIAKNDPKILDYLRKGSIYFALSSFSDAAVAANQSDGQLAIFLASSIKNAFSSSGKSFPAPAVKEEYTNKLEEGLKFLDKYVFGTYSGKGIVAPRDYFNELEQFEVKTKDHTVKISPKQCDVMKYVNKTLTATASPSLDAGETLEYEWTTAGQFGVLKNGSSEGKTFTTTTNTINYYGNNAPNEQNYEKVTVTVYIKNASGKRKHGSDTATINVTKVKVVMKPTNVELSPINGSSSMKLFLLNSDGTDPIVNGSSLQHRVEWSTAGTYGNFTGGNTTYATSVNNITYNATDNQVASGTETIKARIYFKLGSGDWIFQEEVTGNVKISNDTKEIIYYSTSQPIHKDMNGWCYVGCVVTVQPVPHAVSYSVTNAETGASITSWNVTGNEGHVQGWTVGIDEEDAGADYLVGIYGTWTWGGGNRHFSPTCGGMYKVTVTVSQ